MILSATLWAGYRAAKSIWSALPANSIKLKRIWLIIPFLLSTAACSKWGGDSSESSIKPSNLCEVSSWEKSATAEACTPGQKVVFLPNRWGNEQLPILFAALNCDLRYSVVSNNGGVSCIYLPTTPANKQSTQK
jgi:hypothetical protein